MNTNVNATVTANGTDSNWAELKGKIKSKWGKFSEDELEGFKGDLSLISGKIQKAYGIAKDQADHQFEEFKKTLAPVGPVSDAAIKPTVN